MIVFRVGADDAEFLEKEFEPEFTPQDIVNLPNFKVYLKLMIDGVSSRPFSAKTLPAMVKSGNKEVEEEVIKSSRALYCKSKEVVEREINNWSGMSLGNETDAGSIEKFPAICSACKKETLVPFKPEAGRTVYCRDCIAKIKSGELKPIAGSIKQIKQDETKFFKPLADLGIEFEQKDKNIEVLEGEDRYQEEKDKDQKEISHPKPSFTPKIFSTLKKVFTKEKTKSTFPVARDTSALKEVLNKALSAQAGPSENKSSVATPIPIPTPPPISLNTLKNENKEKQTKDRSASVEEMNKLKNFIKATNIPVLKEEKILEPDVTNVEEKKVEDVKTADKNSNIKTKEVPEDVLRKILE
jgi:CxxC-x17-CxxC domain-containing protein